MTTKLVNTAEFLLHMRGKLIFLIGKVKKVSDGCHCFCSTVDCWDGPDGEPIVHHGYTLTSKILFKDVIETINKYAFIKNEYVYSVPT